MDEYEIDERLSGRVEEVQSEGPLRIIDPIIGAVGGQERGSGRQVGLLAPKTQDRLRSKYTVVSPSQ